MSESTNAELPFLERLREIGWQENRTYNGFNN